MNRLADTLLWLCSIPSPIGEEKSLCDALHQRFSGLGLPLRRIGDSLVVNVRRGTGGPKMALVPSSLRAALREAGVVVEPMDTGAACRTYNVLMAEGRHVAAALIAVE